MATHTDLHRRQGRRRSLRPSCGRPLLHLPRVLRRPRSLKASPTRVTSSRNALTARTKRYGLTSCSTGLKTQLSAACLLLRGQLTCLPSCPRWATREGKLPAQTLRSILPPSQIGFQSKWRQKRGAFGISTRPHGGPLDRGRQPDKPRKTGRLTRQGPHLPRREATICRILKRYASNA